MNKDSFWIIITIVELLLAAAVILLDLFIPTIVILGIIAISLLIRREKLSALGFQKAAHPLRMAGMIFLLVIGWNLLLLGLIMPILAHGFSNSIGLIAFYFVGPIYGLW
jgi:hypothetical protein